MFDINGAHYDVVAPLEGLEGEVALIYPALIDKTQHGPLHGLPRTLHGYMMVCLAHIDRLSSYWCGPQPPRKRKRNQTARMVDFMATYLSDNREAHNVAVQIWRHKLMHTGLPRRLCDKQAKISYWYLLHWEHDLPIAQHYSFTTDGTLKIFNIGFRYFLADLKRAAETYLGELATDPVLQARYTDVNKELAHSKFRPLRPSGS